MTVHGALVFPNDALTINRHSQKVSLCLAFQVPIPCKCTPMFTVALIYNLGSNQTGKH